MVRITISAHREVTIEAPDNWEFMDLDDLIQNLEFDQWSEEEYEVQ